MTARLQHASIRIQLDMLEDNFGGTVSFWRNGDSWLPPLLHSENWGSGSKLLFVDGFDAGNGDIKVFVCKAHLWQMPEEYQSGFIADYWPDFSIQTQERLQYSYGPPPTADLEILNAEIESAGIQGGLWMLH
jgi:hypothetical protein